MNDIDWLRVLAIVGLGLGAWCVVSVVTTICFLVWVKRGRRKPCGA